MSKLEEFYNEVLYDEKKFKSTLHMTKRAFLDLYRNIQTEIFPKPFPEDLFFFLHFATLREAKYDQFLLFVGLSPATAYRIISRVSY